MVELISMTYEQARAEHFETLKAKAEYKMNYWAAKDKFYNPNNLKDPTYGKASEYAAEYNYYKDALEALENQPKWISVEERLPEYDAKVLVVIPRYYGCDIRTARLYKSGAWLIGDMSAVGSTPTHWMPLPEPPKEVE